MNLKNNFSLSTLKRYFDFLKVKQSSSATLQRKISSLSSFADFLTKRGLIDSQDYSQLNLIVGSVKSKRKHFDYPHFLNRYFVLGSLIALFLGLAYSLYQQSVLKARQQLAYSTAAQPVRPGRIMSFQGRLTDSVGNPITSSTAINFKFFNSSIGGTQLYDSAIGNSQVVVPDSNGIFNVVIGKSHGSEIPQNVFSENPEVWLQITTGNEVMEPRQQIATVAYALNSETLQGLPPSSTGEKNTVVILDNQGNLNLGESSPAIISQSGTFSLEGQSILIKADDGGGGGGIKLLTEGTAPATGGFVDFSNPNISSGNLLNSQITNTNRGYNFISFQNYNIGTSQLSTRFSVDANGNGIFSNNLSVGSTLTTNTLKATQAQDTNLVTNLNADLLDGYHANNLPYDNYRYWTAAAGGNTSNIGSTSTLNFVGGHGVGVTLSGNTLTFTNTSIGTTYAAGIALSLTPTNVFNLRYNPTLAIDTNNQVGLNLDNSNTWTVVQNFNNNFTVGSTAVITNLNADLLDGLDSTYFVNIGQTGSLPYVNNAYDSTLTRYGTGPYTLGLNLANSNTWTIIQRFTAGIGVTGNSTFTNNLSVGGTLTTTTLKATNAMDTTVVTNLNADLLDGLDSTAFVGVGQTGNFLTDIIAGQGINVTGTGTNRTVALNLGATNTWLAPQNFSQNFTVGSTAVIANLNADLLDGLSSSQFLQVGGTGYDNYQYWTATAGLNTVNVGSTSTLNFASGGGLSIVLSGNTLTFTSTGIGTTYNAGTALSLAAGNTFNVLYDSSFAVNGTNQLGLNLGNSNTWTAVQNFNNNFTVGSTTKVTNLNADLLDGLDSTAFVGVGQTGSLPYVNNAYDSTLTRYGTGPYTLGLNLANSNTWTIIQRFTAGIGVTGNSTFTNNLSVGGTLTTTTLKATNAMDTTVVTNLNADLLDGRHATNLLYVNNATNATLTRSGTGPYTLGLNLANANTWTALQTFNASGAPFAVGSTTKVTNLNADFLDGLHANQFLQIGGTGYLASATNGLQLIGTNSVGLGGTLTQTTLIDQNNFDLSLLNGKLGLGTSSPSQQLDMTGSINLSNTTNTNQNGVIYKNGVPFLHNFRNTNTDGNNLFLGENAGNFTMGVGASYNYESSNNIGIGSYALSSNTTGYQNTALGNYSLYSNTTGSDNTALGHASLQSNTTGSSNTALGHASLQFNTTSWGNTALGNFSLQSNTTGWGNTALGNLSFLFNTDGYYNIAIGNQAGNYLTDGSTGNTSPDYSIYIGANTTSLVDNSQNEIVIGYNATGNGSNSVTLGADTINKTILKGNVGLGTTAPSKKLDIVGDINLTGTIFANGTAGTNGQVLASTGTGLQWGNAAALTNPTNGLQLINTDSIGLGGTLTQNTIINNPNHSLSIIGQSNTVGLHVSNIGTVAIGTSTPEGIFHIAGRGVANQNFRFDWASNDANYKPTLFTVRARDNSGVNSPVINGDSLFMHEISGIAGSGIPYSAARWGGGVDGTVAATSVPGYLYFSTTTEGNTGPTERMRITSTGNIGIGTTLPTSMLDVTISNGWDGISLHSNTGNGIAYLAGDSSHNGLLQLYPNSSTYTVKITSSGNSFFNGGNVGIGTASPESLLHINPSAVGTSVGNTMVDIRIKQGASSGNISIFDTILRRHTAGSTWSGTNVRLQRTIDVSPMGFIDFGINGISSDQGLGFGSNNTTNMVIKSDGNVGIGTTSPGGLLQLGDIYTSGGKNLIIGDDTYLTDVDAAHTLGLYSNSNTAYGSLKLSANGGTISGYNGNIGIGTGSPQYTLDVNGTIRLGGITGQDQAIENNYGNYLHLGAWGVNRTATNAVLVNTAYMADTADQLDGHHADTAYNSFGNGTVPVRHPSGYLYTNYLNTSANVTATAPTHFAIQTGSDNFIRWQTLASVRTNLLTNAVGTGALKTATTSTSGKAATNVSMNDYTFFPNAEVDDCVDWDQTHMKLYETNSSNNTIGRFNASTRFTCSSGSWDVRWRYITASDRPTIWLIVNADGEPAVVWESEDPVNPKKYPENPNPLADNTLSSGQYFASVEPLTVAQLNNLFSQLPSTDQNNIIVLLKEYIVDQRGWLTQLTSIQDLDNIENRYHPSGRQWAMRIIAEYYDFSTSDLILETMIVVDSKLELRDPFSQVLNNYLTQRKNNLKINQELNVEKNLITGLPDEYQKADIAEWYATDGISYNPGTILSINENKNLIVKPSTTEYDPHVIGIVATSSDSILGKKINTTDAPIALNGRVPVKIDPSSDPIKPGDPITSSGNSGLAKKSIKAGAIIGKALEKWDPGSEKNSVMVFINISWYDPDVFLSDTGQVAINYNVSDEVLASLGYSGTKNEIEAATYSLTDSLGNAVTRVGQYGNLAAAKIETAYLSAKSIIVDNLAARKIASETILTGDLTATSATVSGTLTTDELISDKLTSKDASFSTVYADQIINPEGNISEVLATKISDLRNEIKSMIASDSAQASPSAIALESETWDTSVATESADLALDNLTLSDSLVIASQLTVNGHTSLNTANVTGTFTVGQIALKDNILETTADTLYIQPSGLGAVNILNGRLVVNSDGNININANVTVSGSLVADLLKASEIETQTLTTEKLNIGIATTSPEASPSSDNNATAGFITLATGQTEVTINNSRLTANSMVYLTPNGSTQNQVPYIKNKTEDNFTIAIDSPLDHDIDINWWLIN